MSHIAKIEILIQDLPSLKESVRRLGMEFSDEKTYKVHGADGRPECDHVIRVPKDHPAYSRGIYEIGVIKNKPGTFREITLADGRKVKQDISNGYSLSWDSWMGGHGLADVVGKGCNILRQTYATVTATRAAQAKGFRVVEHRLANGAVQLRCTK